MIGGGAPSSKPSITLLKPLNGRSLQIVPSMDFFPEHSGRITSQPPIIISNEASLLNMSAPLLTLLVLYSILPLESQTIGIVAKKHGIGRFRHSGSGKTAARERQGNNAVGTALVPYLSATLLTSSSVP